MKSGSPQLWLEEMESYLLPKCVLSLPSCLLTFALLSPSWVPHLPLLYNIQGFRRGKMAVPGPTLCTLVLY